jgi:hypothetical protein
MESGIQVGSTLSSHSKGLSFKSQPGDLLSSWKFFMVCLLTEGRCVGRGHKDSTCHTQRQ